MSNGELHVTLTRVSTQPSLVIEWRNDPHAARVTVAIQEEKGDMILDESFTPSLRSRWDDDRRSGSYTYVITNYDHSGSSGKVIVPVHLE
jgi:hypothetical protein